MNKDEIIRYLHGLLGRAHLMLAGEDAAVTDQEMALLEDIASWQHARSSKRHDHSRTDPWSAGPNGPTAYLDGCAIEGAKY